MSAGSSTQAHADLMAAYEQLAERLDTIESRLAIERLANRYAFAADARDLDNLLLMFIDDVDCGRFGKGREALRSSYDIVHRQFYRTVHQVVGHTVDFDDKNHARGKVMMRAEHEVGERWIVSMLCMFDDYERREGEWYFVRRKPESWYTTDFERQPVGPSWQAPDWSGRAPRLPQLFSTWAAFWDDHHDRVAQLTLFP